MKPGRPVVGWGEAPSQTHSAGPNSPHSNFFVNNAEHTSSQCDLERKALWYAPDAHARSNASGGLGCNRSPHQAILRKYLECVETTLGIPGRAAVRLKEQFELMF
jgi:hypothetical protein